MIIPQQYACIFNYIFGGGGGSYFNPSSSLGKRPRALTLIMPLLFGSIDFEYYCDCVLL